MEQAAAKDVELPRQVVEVLAKLLKVGGLKLAQRVVNLELDVLRQVKPLCGWKGLVKLGRVTGEHLGHVQQRLLVSVKPLDIDKNIKELNGEEFVEISSIFLSESL